MNKLINMKRIFLFIPILLLLNISITGCNDYTVLNNSLDEIATKTFNTSPGKKFELKASFGDVYITTSEDPVVKVKILGSEEVVKKVKFDYENTDEGVKVIAERKNKWNIFGLWNHMHLKFEITLPSKYNAEVSSSGGDLYLKDLNGDINFKTSGGDVEIRSAEGSLKVKTSGGDINIKNFNGGMKLGTSGGDITALYTSGDLYASTSGGDINLEAENGKIHASTSGGEIGLKYKGENQGIDLYSSGGDISVLLPEDFSADANLNTSGGSVNCRFKPFDVQEMSSHKLVGQFNKGGAPFIVKTSGGDIDVK